MSEELNINILVSNILDEKHYSHCRLCLKYIEDNNFAKFQDCVSSIENYLLEEVLTKVLGRSACTEIPGIDAVCSNCLDKALQTLNFIQQYEESTLILSRVLDKFEATLNIDIDSCDKNQDLYIILCGEEAPQLVFLQNENQVKKPVEKAFLKCDDCKISFDNIIELKEHNISHHEMYTCVKCIYTSKNKADLLEHEVSTEFYKCKNCPQFRCSEESLRKHEDGTHAIHVCKECGKSFKGLNKLLAHEVKHKTKNICPKCGKTYTTKEFYMKHVKLCLEDLVDPHPMRSRIEKTYFCQECGKGYSTPGGLRVHKRFDHGDAKPHVCNQCGKKFNFSCYLKVHMVTHTKEKNFHCDICHGKFVSKEALLSHKRRHTGEKPYACDICNEKFVNASARAEHIKFKHIGPTLNCELCSRKFVTKNFLRMHMKKHYDPKNKLYIGRNNTAPNVPGEQNMRVRIAE